MSAKSALAAQLDALMGKERNVPENQVRVSSRHAAAPALPRARPDFPAHGMSTRSSKARALQLKAAVLQRTNKKVRFFDNEIDKYWLCGCSPYILFKNSKSDLGKLNPKP
jgi:hypothetical protein